MAVLILFDFSATIDPAHISWELAVFLFPWLHFQSPSSSYYSNVGVPLAFSLGLLSEVLDLHPSQSHIPPWLQSVPVTIDYWHYLWPDQPAGHCHSSDHLKQKATFRFLFLSFNHHSFFFSSCWSSQSIGFISDNPLRYITFSLFLSLLWLNLVFVFSSFN